MKIKCAAGSEQLSQPITGLQQNRRILIVDDNEAIHQDFRKILNVDSSDSDFDTAEAELLGSSRAIRKQRAHFEMDFAFQGEEALRFVQAAIKAGRRYAMVFMDVRMPPGWDGLETTQKLWEADPDLQVVLCTAFSDRSWEEMMETLGSSERLLILKKPFDAIEVLQFAHALTEKWSFLQAARFNTLALELLVDDRTSELRGINKTLQSEIVERKLAEEALHEAGRFAQATIDALSTYLCVLDEEGRILATNQAWRECADGNPLLPQRAKVGDNYLQVCDEAVKVDGSKEGEIAVGIRAVIDGAKANFTLEYNFQSPTENHWFIGRVTRFPNEGKVCVVVAHENITERREAERLALRSQRLESIGTLASGVAHDLNNALAPIMMGVEILKMQYPDASRIIEMIESSSKRGAEMVRQLLTFAKGAEGERVSIQPRHLLLEMQKMMQGTFPKNIQIVFKSNSNLPTVLGDSTQLDQVLLNLCINARDAMPFGGILTLEADAIEVDTTYASGIPDAKAGRYLVIRVRDTGTGIPPEILDQIFDPFFTTKGPNKGTGLGLSTVMGIVKGHGGFIHVYSQPGHGSTFTVHVPAEEAGKEVKPPAIGEAPFRGNGETILLVDDEPIVREVARAVLRRLNFEPLTATDGADALIKAAENRANLRANITDIHMPHMDGLNFIRALRRMLPDIPVLVTSGQLEEAVAEEFKTLGVSARLDKPFTEIRLAEALKNLICSK
ncbi:MAG: hypothetical protein JWO95_3528 [Verrucomicrobiales bacterium]|nr:hypothetical protein [Verrucomicrobiales bacterium]